MSGTRQQLILAAKEWLLGMQNPSGGFAGSFSFIRGKRPDFAEVTGYIIPTLIGLGELETAQKAGEWLLSIQKPEGWFFHWPAPNKPMVFDTGQVIFGLLALSKNQEVEPPREVQPPKIKYLQAAIRAGDWICSVQEPDGSWIKCSYNNIPHTYYSRVSWALLELWKITGDEKYKSAAVRQLDWVLAQQRPDGSFDNCSFFNDGKPVLHVVAYTIEGLFYSGLLLGDSHYIEAAKRGLKKLPLDSWSCLTGLAQLSCVLFKLYEITKDEEIASSRLRSGLAMTGPVVIAREVARGDQPRQSLNAIDRSPKAADEAISCLKQARRINRFLRTKQILKGPRAINGALPGSYPIWKRYMPFSLPVWSAKFWLDALLWEEKFKRDYLTAAIFPNDSLAAYLAKGELRKNYFNPGNVFSEIVIVDAKKSNYSPEEKQQLSWMMGGARFKIYDLRFKNRDVEADVVRAYGVGKPAEQAARLSRHLNTPLVISLHGNYDLDNRYQTLRQGAWLKYLYYTFRSWLIIPKILKRASKILAVYQFAADYALAKNISKDKIAVIYNRVYPDVFYPMSSLRGTPNLFRGTEAISRNRRTTEIAASLPRVAPRNDDVFTLIVVGRLIPGKNQQCIIKAIKNLNVRLIVVGRGPEESNLKKSANFLGVVNKVEFIEKIDNKELIKLYNQADAYVTACQYGGVEIPVIEAMACSLPIIRSKHLLEKEPELLGFDGCLYAENNPESFAEAIKKMMTDKDLYQRLSRKSSEIYDSINGWKMEEKERELIISVL